MSIIRKLWYIFSPSDRRNIVFILIAMVIGAVLETLGIGLILPFIRFVNNPQLILEYPKIGNLMDIMGLRSHKDIIVFLAAGLFFFYIIKNIYLAVLTDRQFRFVYYKQAALSCRLLEVYMKSPWTFHLRKNSAELLRNITKEVAIIFGNILNPMLVLISESLVVISIIILLLWLAPIATVVAVSVLGLGGLVFYRFIKNNADKMGKERQMFDELMIKWVNQSLGGIKEIKIFGRESFFIDSYSENSLGFAKVNRYLATVSQLPRFFFEVLIIGGMMLVVSIFLWTSQGSVALVPMLALFAGAALRLMPSMNRVVGTIANIRYHAPAILVVHQDLKRFEKVEAQENLENRLSGLSFSFNEKVEFCCVSYQYPEGENEALKDVFFTFSKGDSIALVGTSGAGKSTLADLILGLIKPTSGHILVDGHDIHKDLSGWQHQIGYVPQFIYLTDDTIRRNVAFGIADPEIEEKRVRRAIIDAQLETLIERLPQGLDTVVAERGVRFSGGERQRMGIARALYHDPAVLIFDEATSSLDMETEAEVIKTIKNFKRVKTVVIISHHISTIGHCDYIYEVKSGKVNLISDNSIHRSSSKIF